MESGSGHCHRTARIFKRLIEMGHSATCLIQADKENGEMNKIGKTITIGRLENHLDLENKSKIYDIGIHDIWSAPIQHPGENAKYLFKKINRLSTSNIYFDSIYTGSILFKYPNILNENLGITHIIRPYAVEEGDELQFNPKGASKILQGHKYAVIGDEYQYIKRKEINKDPSKILVSCGGSDPRMISRKAIIALNAIKNKLHIIVVVGNLFCDELKEQINTLSLKSKHLIESVYAPNTLISYMQWCDIAISTSGLTKYELAATGTPSILIAINEEDQQLNLAFLKKGCAIGLKYNCRVADLTQQIKILMEDRKLRKEQSAKGLQLIDGKGLQRICDMVAEL